jgi:hypothetical protein
MVRLHIAGAPHGATLAPVPSPYVGEGYFRDSAHLDVGVNAESRNDMAIFGQQFTAPNVSIADPSLTPSLPALNLSFKPASQFEFVTSRQ